MKITELPGGAKLVKRYRSGRCFAAAWSADSTEQQIRHDMSMGEAAFFPFNESTNTFTFDIRLDGGTCVPPLRFKR